MQDIIYLELDEEIPSVIDKIKGISARDVTLVIPKNASIIQSVINLKILKKEADSLSKNILLVTQDSIGRNLASQVGLPVYDSVKSTKPIVNPVRSEPTTSELIEVDLSQKKQAPPKGVNVHDYQQSPVSTEPQKPAYKPLFKKREVGATQAAPVSQSSISNYKPKPVGKNTHKTPGDKKKKIIKITALVVVILGLLVATYFYLPKATINMVLKGESYSTDVEILVDNNINKPDDATNTIPGELVEVESEEAKTYPATGTKDLGEKASGTIKLSNGTGVEQTAAAGTAFTASGLTFIATESVTVDKATATVDAGGNVVKSPGTATIRVQAQEAGDKYNIGPSSFSTSVSVSAESTNSMTGGVSKQIKVVTEEDIAAAQEELRQELTQKNLQAILSEANNLKLIDSSIVNQEGSFSSSKTVGSEADSFEARMQIKSRAIGFNEEQYRNMVIVALNKNVPENKEAILSADDKISTNTANADFSTGILKLEQTVDTHIGEKINEDEVKQSVTGQKTTQAEDSIKQSTQAVAVTIDIKPSWWPKRLPQLSKNITIERKTETNTESE